ncbi:MAG: threonylcarbamoyl-AMP synthase [Lachnospiraceae bacterium]|nr:threonylcarbamoyl-AMP synthase [Lachnospiraceae bacterium]
METKIIRVPARYGAVSVVDVPEEELESLKAELAGAADLLRAGELVAFPTETVYGLGGDAMNPQAAKKIYAAKNRPSDNPLIAHISNRKMLADVAEEIPETAVRLMDAFWPGPLTLILKKKPEVPDSTTGGLDTVAVRMPEHPVAAALIEAFGGSVAAPSANLSGKPSPTDAEYVKEDMNGRIAAIVDGGSVKIGLESTIVDVTGECPVILRPGFITKEMLEETVGEVRVDPAVLSRPDEHIRPKAPGMKYRHYAPKAPITLFEGETSAVVRRILDETGRAEAEGRRVGIIAVEETAEFYRGNEETVVKVSAGSARGNEETVVKVSAGSAREDEETAVKVSAGSAREDEETAAKVSAGSNREDEETVDEETAAKKLRLVKTVGSESCEEEIAHNLFRILREFDDSDVDVIFSESFPEDHLGFAIMNRLKKAAGYQIVRV